MRSSEILGLRLSQVDIKRRIVRLSDTKNDSARTVPLTRNATRVFQEVLSHPLRPRGCALLFFGEPGRDGERSPYSFKKSWNGIKKKLGLADLHFRDLRHEAVSRLVEAGLSDQEVSAISGHKSMQMRLAALELIDEREQLNLWKRRSARFGGKSEPLDDQLVPEQPRLMRRAVGLIVESGVMSREAIPDRAGLSARDVENLAGLPEGYFAPTTSRVVDLNAVRLRRG